MNMKKMFNLITLVAMLLCFISQDTQAQEINMVDEQNYYEISENSDGLALVVTIDGMRKVADFEQGSGVIPKYLGKYKNALVFMDEVDRTRRNIMVFRPIDGYVWQTTYENELCKPAEREECIMFYADTAVKVEFNKKGGPKTKFTKLDSKYSKLKGHTISSCGGEFNFSDD